MSQVAIVLGANGRFGRAATTAFLADGWRVRSFARSFAAVVSDQAARPTVEPIEGNAFDAPELIAAAAGCDVIVNALNPPYPRWSRDIPRITANVIAAAKAAGAAVMIPGNVYNYGHGMPALLKDDTPQLPTTRKGELRRHMEQTYAAACVDGVQTIILRAGDFIEREKTGNWFDSHIAAKVTKGRVMYPGPLDRVHAWAYLPDLARAMVGLAEKRAELAQFEQFGFPGYALTGRMLVDAIERAVGRSLAIKALPWPTIRLLGLVMPLMREVAEMSYLWNTPHAIDGTKMAAVLPDFQSTPLDTALADALGDVAAVNGDALQLAAPMPRPV